MTRGHNATRVIGFVAATLMHAAMIAGLVWEPAARRIKPPDVQGPGASSLMSSAEPGPTMVLVQLHEISTVSPAEELASQGTAPANLLVQMVSADSAPAFDFTDVIEKGLEEANAADQADSAAVRAMFFGRYTRQIDARVLRAWRRPRSPISAANANEGFHCDVRISQDSRGFVQEVQLVSCNGSLEWQRSLVAAIDSASPLPAPPRPSVFSNVLSMTFEATAFTTGSHPDGYENERDQLAQTR